MTEKISMAEREINSRKINIQNNDGDTSLHLVTRSGSFEATKIILRLNPFVNQANNKGETALHIATIEDKLEIVKLLLSAGADPHLKDKTGNTSMHYAAADAKIVILSLFSLRKEKEGPFNPEKPVVTTSGTKKNDESSEDEEDYKKSEVEINVPDNRIVKELDIRFAGDDATRCTEISKESTQDPRSIGTKENNEKRKEGIEDEQNEDSNQSEEEINLPDTRIAIELDDVSGRDDGTSCSEISKESSQNLESISKTIKKKRRRRKKNHGNGEETKVSNKSDNKNTASKFNTDKKHGDLFDKDNIPNVTETDEIRTMLPEDVAINKTTKEKRKYKDKQTEDYIKSMKENMKQDNRFVKDDIPSHTGLTVHAASVATSKKRKRKKKYGKNDDRKDTRTEDSIKSDDKNIFFNNRAEMKQDIKFVKHDIPSCTEISEQCKIDSKNLLETYRKRKISDCKSEHTEDFSLSEHIEDSTLSDETEDSTLTELTEDSALTEQTRDSTLFEQTKDSILPEQTRDYTLSEQTRIPNLSEHTEESTFSEETEDSALTEQTKDSILPEQTRDYTLSEQTRDSTLSQEDNKYCESSNDHKQNVSLKREREVILNNPVIEQECLYQESIPIHGNWAVDKKKDISSCRNNLSEPKDVNRDLRSVDRTQYDRFRVDETTSCSWKSEDVEISDQTELISESKDENRGSVKIEIAEQELLLQLSLRSENRINIIKKLRKNSVIPENQILSAIRDLGINYIISKFEGEVMNSQNRVHLNEFHKNKFSVNDWTESGHTVLHLASKFCDEIGVRKILKKNPDVNALDFNRITPFMMAAVGGSVKIGKMLLKAGADINLVEIDGLNALHIASTFGNLSFVKYLLSLGLNPNAKCDTGDTPLHLAAKKGSMDIATALLKGGASKNETNVREITPAPYALFYNNFELFNLLYSEKKKSVRMKH